jgi:Cu(I)/Ag(I) efflux system membrane protein CusA/SilA
MIAALIRWCVYNRVMVLLLSGVLVAAGAWAARNITVDAIPDLSDVQVVVRVDYAGQAPQVVQDQAVYPLTTALLAVPEAKVVRGYSMFGSGFVYVIFDDGTDLYWARSRVLEQLSTLDLPPAAKVTLGPDATGVGWVYQYALTTEPGGGGADVDLAELRSIQDFYLKPELTAVEGVSEVASIGGFVKQYQVTVDPVKLLAYDLPLSQVRRAILDSNRDTGGRVVELGEAEYMVRGLGYLGSGTADERGANRGERGADSGTRGASPDERGADLDTRGAESDERGAKRSERGADSDTRGADLRTRGADSGERGANVDDRTDTVLSDLRRVAVGVGPGGSPIYLGDVATVGVGPDIRRGAADLNGQGEVAGGIVVMRFGENARETIDRVKTRLAELSEGLPDGVSIVTTYDRSDLIDRAVHTLTGTLIEEILVVSLVVLLFLLHARSAFVAAITLPAGVLGALGVMYVFGINANIMSLGGIAISIGVMIDSAIIMVENAHKHIEHRKPGQSHLEMIAEAASEVGPTLFFSLLIITVSFLPIFVLGGQSGRLFTPLAYTKTLAIFGGAVLAVTLIPALMTWLIKETGVLPTRWPKWARWTGYAAIIVVPALLLTLVPLPQLGDWRWWMVGGWLILSAALVLPQRIISEEKNPISRLLAYLYDPAFAFVMQYKTVTLVLAGLLLASTWYPLSRLGSEFMPPLEEGDLLYMPTTDPGLSITKARELLQQTDRLILQFPEVTGVFGKAGRADTATDPAPLTMLETNITLVRDKSQWRTTRDERFYSDWPGWLQSPFRTVFPDERPITTDELIYGYMVEVDGQTLAVPGLNDAVRVPGLTNSWTQPIRTRIDMLSTGIRTPIGVKVMGDDLRTLGDVAGQIADGLKGDPRTAGVTTSAFAEKTTGGRYLDINIDREAIARFGLSVSDVQDTIMSALGGMNVTTTVEGLERYPVNLRYPSELRDDLPAIRRTLVGTPTGAQVPLGQLADLSFEPGPPMVKSENARLTAWVYVDIANVDIGSYVENAKRVVAERVDLPAGYSIAWSGQYQYMQEARAKLLIAVPLAGAAILLLLYLATRSWLRVAIVLLAVPFSLVGAMWLVYLLDYDLSLAVWVGVIALAGLDAETGLVMLLYLDNSYEDAKKRGRMRDKDDLWHAIHHGAVQRIRPKTMTVVTTFTGLLPLLFATGAGADTMRRLAAPMVGGLVTSFLLELLIYPVLFYAAKRWSIRRLSLETQTRAPV